VTDLFLSAGLDLPHGSGAGPAKSQTRKTARVPLVTPRVLEDAIKNTVYSPTAEQLAAAKDYARIAKSAGFAKQKETSVRDIFYTKILGTVLGYTRYDPDETFSLHIEKGIRTGSADAAIGRFSDSEGDELIAPLEMKGPAFLNLDAIIPGRGQSPVQQAWGYAMDAPGVSWVLVSNCVEIRLYRFGRGRDCYENFDLKRLDEPDELRRLYMLLDAKRLLEGQTEALLLATDNALKTVTDDLYAQYKNLRDQILAYVTSAADGPKLSRRSAIEPVQKLLDRILFVAFGGGTGLLPPRLLQTAATAHNSFNPQPIWNNFQQLFKFVDKGSGPPLHIWAYNGGLFAPDARLDALALPDHLTDAIAELGQWDFGNEVPVTVLGRIFEQSITDLEKLRAEAEGKPAPEVGKVKKEGVVYTPDHIARFLVEHTIGRTLAERFNSLLKQHTGRDSLPKSEDDTLWPSDAIETKFWLDYLEALRGLTILDPACGSGAFLAAAFDVLVGEYARVLERLAELNAEPEIDAFDEILGSNLFGVDLNIESVEISRLSLWLKTARQKHPLASLNETVRDGNSLIAEKKYAERPFNWDGRFANIAKQGGFDIVIGNPPYVRMEYLTDQKPYLSEHYKVADDRTDLYAYFFEKAVDVMKVGGRLGYISSSTFFRIGSGENLRRFMAEETAIEAVIDFGDEQVFEGVTTYPAIITAQKLAKGQTPEGELRFFNIKHLPTDLSSAFEGEAQTMPRARLTATSWQFEGDALAQLREKIARGRKTLGEVYGAPLYGIKTGLNEAFIIDTKTRDALVARDAKSADLLKPFLKGEHIKRWRVEPEGLFLINIPKAKIKIEDYPAIRDHLLPFKAALEKRATEQEWYELQQAQVAYQPGFEKAKISYPHFQNNRMFTLEKRGHYSNDKSYFIPSDNLTLLALLNSNVAWSFLSSISPAVRDGWHEMRVQYVELLPIPEFQNASKLSLAKNAQSCTNLSSQSLNVLDGVRNRISSDLGNGSALNKKLHNWHQFDFTSFQAEIKKAFKIVIPPKERSGWEDYLTSEAQKVNALTTQITAAEAEINTLVYAAFDLTPDEITLLETSLEGQV
jgi:Eco57I restriction-modification methylase/TaqI-like C-terminal specificity domain